MHDFKAGCLHDARGKTILFCRRQLLIVSLDLDQQKCALGLQFAKKKFKAIKKSHIKNSLRLFFKIKINENVCCCV